MADLKEDLFNAWLYSCVNKLKPNIMGWNMISIFTNSCLPFKKSEKAFILTLSERFFLSLILYVLKVSKFRNVFLVSSILPKTIGLEVQ